MIVHSYFENQAIKSLHMISLKIESERFLTSLQENSRPSKEIETTKKRIHRRNGSVGDV